MRPHLLAFALIFLSLWAIYLLVGQLLDAKFQFLTLESAVISARAILQAESPSLSLFNLPMTHPPLPYLLSVPFAALRLPNPSIFISSLLASLLCSWFLYHFRALLARYPLLSLPLLAIPIQPGLLHSAITGNSTISALAPLTLSTYLVARFVLEQEVLVRRRLHGKVTAWLNEEIFKAERMRFLWSSALLLALASLGRFDLILALPLYLLAAPWLLPQGERRDLPRILTVALVYLFPLLAVQFMWAYLCWVFTGDPFYGLRHPSSYFLQVGPELLASANPASPAPTVPPSPTPPPPTLSRTLPSVTLSALLTCPLLPYLLLRLRNLGILALCAAPYLVLALSQSLWPLPPARDFFALAYLQATLLLLLALFLGALHRLEALALPPILAATSFLAWAHFATSPLPEERALPGLLARRPPPPTLQDQRLLAAYLRANPPPTPILLDDLPGFAFITLLRTSTPFLLPSNPRFPSLAQNPHLLPTPLLLRNHHPHAPPDAVAQKWRYLQPSIRALFRPALQTHSWTLLEPIPSAIPPPPFSLSFRKNPARPRIHAPPWPHNPNPHRPPSP